MIQKVVVQSIPKKNLITHEVTDRIYLSQLVRINLLKDLASNFESDFYFKINYKVMINYS